MRRANSSMLNQHLQEYDLETLLAGITDENRHEGVDFGAPVGLEVIPVDAGMMVRTAHPTVGCAVRTD